MERSRGTDEWLAIPEMADANRVNITRETLAILREVAGSAPT
ncbi:MAG: hypothetical protein RIF36_23580 [Imperialibacter sp.]